MSKISFMEVIDKTFEGPYMSQEKFDLEVFVPELSNVINKYKIQYDPDICVPNDDELADRVFQAGLEFYQNVGTYCVDTERVVRFTEVEILAALKTAVAEVYFGEGKDRRRLVGRKPDSSTSPFCFLGAGGVSVSSDELFIKLVQAYGEIDIADSLTMPSMIQVNGRRVRPNSPLEVMAAIYSTRLMREGLNRAGRSGMPTMNAIACASSDVAKIAGSIGLRPTDGWMMGSTAELKVETSRLNEIAYVRELGGRIVAETTPLLGGYCGGPEGVAVASVAYHLHAIMILRGDCQLHAPLHIKHVCATDPRVLWALSLGAQAITRNSHFPLMISPFMASGPMEEMCFLETAAAVTAIIASGSNLEGLITHGGATTDLLGPLTTQFSGEIAHAVVGMDRKEADSIVGRLCEKYKGNIENAPKGKTYQQAYDVKTGKPLPESIQTYERMKKVIAGYGITI
ncbi:MAG: monomethylamine:corrinoid methyltransferase [Desulfobacterales bacterium]|jgi:methylamine--corrinoid protein Co-methyltransferase